ncbi:unnamed protein product, partial [Prorocentrum cordatum]
SSSYDESAFAQVGARGSLTGEVRFAERDGAETAILSLNGSLIRGCAIMVQRDDMSKDGTKLIVSNLPHGMQWQQLLGCRRACLYVVICCSAFMMGARPSSRH